MELPDHPYDYFSFSFAEGVHSRGHPDEDLPFQLDLIPTAILASIVSVVAKPKMTTEAT